MIVPKEMVNLNKDCSKWQKPALENYNIVPSLYNSY